MENSLHNTPPILLLIFNRPEKVAQLISSLRPLKPTQIYVAADGPRPGNTKDATQCEAARRVIETIDWPCHIQKRYSETNAGCRYGITHALDWFFTHEEHGIILEDDCIPHFSFFSFCTQLLERYKDDNRIMHISGNNFQNGIIRGSGSYYFSHYTHSWGWATWKRAWAKYNETIKKTNRMSIESVIDTTSLSKKAKKFWTNNIDYTINRADSWDSLWLYTVWAAKGMSILPNVNLVTNIGFDHESTHTYEKSKQANIPTTNLTNIIHPTDNLIDTDADEYTFRTHFYKSFSSKVNYRLRGILIKLWKKVR